MAGFCGRFGEVHVHTSPEIDLHLVLIHTTDLRYYKYFAKHVRVRFLIKYFSDLVTSYTIQRLLAKECRKRDYEASLDFSHINC